MNTLESLVRKLTVPVNGQLPRPWMTALEHPASAEVFIVGLNQATPYLEKNLSHDRHIDALFNRNGEQCRHIYDEVRGNTSRRVSPTRRNIDKITQQLTSLGITNVLETDLVCYSTKSWKELQSPEHREGKERGEEIFRVILNEIRPPFLISHGVKTSAALGKVLGVELPEPAKTAERIIVHPVIKPTYTPLIFIVPSLSPQPGVQWTDASIQNLSQTVADEYVSYLVAQKTPRNTVERIKWHRGDPIV